MILTASQERAVKAINKAVKSAKGPVTMAEILKVNAYRRSRATTSKVAAQSKAFEADAVRAVGEIVAYTLGGDPLYLVKGA